MSETDPRSSEQHAGDVGAHRATVGTPTERESINVPPTRPGAADNARKAEAARREHETFVPETPIPDERSEAAGQSRKEEETLKGARGEDDEEEEEAVRKDIQETRKQMGETISALADKADVKARAGHAAEVARDRAADAAEAVKDKAADAAETVRHKASEAAGKMKGNTPDQVKDAAEEAKKRPMLLIAVAGAVTAFVVRRMVRRRRANR